MPNVTVQGSKTFTVEEDKKLVLALEDNGIDILHRCGGKAKCTTCRVEVLQGNFGPLTNIEKEAFERKGIEDTYRLSCQVYVTEDVTVRPIMTESSTNMDVGPRPEE
ncbi:2Fe-2S iron-sulfur cluster-binding protein [Evansella cellulosilytica]|uniref:Ferredoxin n=1 Tax=Evansella cellulosilytica (strain ATCC 21833 / DSM 2522 / FERM P-1141 / JCM 9156 / N-4) TaxID=649639 RepID=E6U286_EVAC2|nr:2Fe-2S iron-sulfur cluster-binding protein [Evansella cellulosilytica]ADU30464.1 ferredoxin [Evansella cellulosilytica DSM 2522]